MNHTTQAQRTNARHDAIWERRPARIKYPALQDLALTIADRVMRDINAMAPAQPDEGMPYKSQCTLELLIAELQSRV